MPSQDPREPQQRLMLFLAAASSLLIFITTERCFIEADVRNAITMAQTLLPHPNGLTIPVFLQQRDQVDPNSIQWSGELTSNCYGIVRISANVPTATGHTLYVFDVSLTAQRLHPGNDAAHQLFAAMQPGTAPSPHNTGSPPFPPALTKPSPPLSN